MNDTYPVKIGEKRYSREFQEEEEFAESWQKVLAQAYGGHATCSCPGRGDRKLAIKLTPGGEKYHLAKFPKTGAEHTNPCRFYAPAPESSGMQAYAQGVVEETDDGRLKIRLARGLKELPTREAATEGAELPRAPGVRKPAMTLLGLLHLLWQEARLNIWYPNMEGKRKSYVVSRELLKAAERIGAGRVDLSEVLLVPADKDRPGAKANEAAVARALKRGLRIVVVAPLARYDAAKYGTSISRLPLSRPFGIPPLYLRNEQWDRLSHSFRDEISFWKSGGTAVAIVQAEVKPGEKWPQARVLDAALMPVSEQWIPFDSSYEATAIAKLVEESRAFEKPLRFDAEEDVVFPDFWLLDTENKNFPLEVFGMGTPEYLARKEVKVRHYNGMYGVDGWWSWEANNDPAGNNIPDLPGKARPRS